MRLGRAHSLLSWAYFLAWAGLLQFAEAATSSSETPSPTTPSPSGAATTPAPTVATTPAPTEASSSSSSTNSRGAVVAWAMFTVAVCVALLILLYNREVGKRRRIHHGDSMRQNLAAADSLQPGYGQIPPPEERDPAMSSF